MDNTSRTVLLIGAACVTGGLMEGAAFAQAPAAPTFTPLYPTAAAPTCISKTPTDCRLPDGHPDLTGLYAAGGPALQNGLASGANGITFAGRGDNFVGFEADGGLFRETQVAVGNGQPQYKPEFWDTIIENEYNGNFEDPAQNCMPNGVPRLGAPAEIIALKDSPFVVLIYTLREIRIVPTDGRSHNLIDVAAETWNGDPVGHWEGDTLVIESVGFTDSNWLAKSGFTHGFQMKVTEKLTRTGNQVTWQAIIDDPEFFVKPWTMDPVVRQVTLDPNAALVEPLPCLDIDHTHTTAHVRSG